MADNLLYEQSNESQMTTEPFVSRQMVYVIDQNNGNYSGQIQIDTSSLSNSGKWAAYSESYLTVPFVICAESLVANANFAANAGVKAYNFLVGLKCGFHQLIGSLSVDYNNTNVVQLTPYTNFYVQYKLMTTMSKADVEKNGQSIGFYPDTATSWDYNVAAAAGFPSGPGVSNNRAFGWESLYPANNGYIFSDTADGGGVVTASAAIAQFGLAAGVYTSKNPSLIGTLQTVANYGFYKRCQWCAFNPDIAPYTQFTVNTTFTTTLFKNYFSEGANATHNYKVWYILARIRMKDVCDFFDKMPITKGSFITLRINTNTSQFTVTAANRAGIAGRPISTALHMTAQPTITGTTNPIMFASAEMGQGGQLQLQNLGAGVIDVRCGIAKVTGGSGTVYSHSQNSCRLYVPLYQMNEDMENSYISLNRTKRIVYRDIYQYSVNVDALATFNSLLSNGLTNPKTVICIPMLQATANNVGITGGDIFLAPYHSPFASEPGTTSPLIALTNFNVQVAGVNQFIMNQDYDFEQWVNELSSQNAINGNLVDGMTSGLIGELEYSNMYRYYTCDVSRRIPIENGVPKSIQIMGKNLANKAITLFVFIEIERSIEISLMTGQKLF
jgi:hypothetical protein